MHTSWHAAPYASKTTVLVFFIIKASTENILLHYVLSYEPNASCDIFFAINWPKVVTDFGYTMFFLFMVWGDRG
jgi:hypothetical protein